MMVSQNNKIAVEKIPASPQLKPESSKYPPEDTGLNAP